MSRSAPEVERANVALYRERHRRAGLCISCSRKARGLRCERHAALHAALMRKRRTMDLPKKICACGCGAEFLPRGRQHRFNSADCVARHHLAKVDREARSGPDEVVVKLSPHLVKVLDAARLEWRLTRAEAVRQIVEADLVARKP